MSASAESGKLRAVLEPVLAETGVDLEQIEVSAAGRRRVLRVVVDKDGGIDLDAVADISRAVSSALDDAGAMGEMPYVLEVTSPGVDRPLTRPAHWRRAGGRLVRVVLKGGKTVTGRVRSADSTGVDLQCGDAGEPRRLQFSEVDRAQVQIEFAPSGADD